MSKPSRTVGAPPAVQGGPRPRGPGMVYGGVTVALLVLLAAIALTTRQPPPPSIAEFAPQAVEQIKDAPTEQSSQFGSGEGGSGLEAGPDAGPEQAAAKGPTKQLDVPRIRRCVGNPPRQIEDPQSPPCVPYWDGDNGGATWKGVTRDEIRIFVPTGDVSADIYPQLESFFNRRFEFYGRKLKFIRSSAGTNAGSALPADQKAIAQEAADAKSFASLRYRTTQGFFYHEDLARRGIPSVTGAEWGFPTSYLNARKPYLWQYMPEADVLFANLGEWACKRLAGKPARHAGDPTLRATQRKFGVILQTYYEGDDTSTAPLEQELSKCGVTPKVLRNPIKTGAGDDTQYQAKDPATAQGAIIQMQNAGVTSIVCLCHYYAFGTLTKAASQQAYSPEWIASSWGELDTIRGIVYLANATPEQTAHMFGLTFRPPQIRNEDEPQWWAVKESDPGRTETPSSVTVANRNFAYRATLELAAAIQMAGPTLTPETLEKGMQRAIFPNPDHPNHPGKVGFRPNRFSMELDGTEYWWSNAALHPYADQGTGTPCYVDRARRYTKGQWPSGGDDVFFTPTCDSGA